MAQKGRKPPPGSRFSSRSRPHRNRPRARRATTQNGRSRGSATPVAKGLQRDSGARSAGDAAAARTASERSVDSPAPSHRRRGADRSHLSPTMIGRRKADRDRRRLLLCLGRARQLPGADERAVEALHKLILEECWRPAFAATCASDSSGSTATSSGTSTTTTSSAATTDAPRAATFPPTSSTEARKVRAR